MSFDLYFLARRAGQSWDEAMAELEDAATDATEDGAPAGALDPALWDQVRDEVRRLLPDAEETGDSGFRELSDDATGMQLSMSGREVSLTVPYWHSGPDAERVVRMLRDVAAAVEGVTGLTAYDPQADAAFLGDGDGSAAATMDRIGRMLVGDTSSSPSAQDGRERAVGDTQDRARPRGGWWARLTGRR